MKKQVWVFLLWLTAINAFPQGPPITTATPVMLGLEGAGIRTLGKFVSKDNANVYIQAFALPYNITPKFQIGGILPFKFVAPNGEKTSGGIADIRLFTKYQLYKKDGKAKTFRILATIRQSFPTGKTSSKIKTGTGIYQTYVGLIAGKISSAIGIYGDFGYNIAGNGVTDNFSYNLSVGIPLLPQKYPQRQINTFLEFNGNYLFDPKIHSLFFSPGIQFIPGRRVLFETGLQIPVFQNKLPANKTKFTFLFGIRFLIR